MPALWHPVFEIEGFERASTDRFFVAVETSVAREQLLKECGALRIVPLETAHG